MEILSTFHTESNTFLTSFRPFKRMRAQMPKNARNHSRNSPFPLSYMDFHLMHECLGPPHSPPKRHLDRFTHFHTTTPKFIPETAPSLRRSPQKSNTPISSPTPLTTQTVSGSIHSFCHTSHVRTDRRDTRMFSYISALLAMLTESDALIIMINHIEHLAHIYCMSCTAFITSPPQSNLRRARRSSADKTSSKLMGSHSPSMLSPFKTSRAE